jgi:hypothetical protein
MILRCDNRIGRAERSGASRVSSTLKKRNYSTGHGRAGNISPDIDLSPALCHAFRDSKNFVGNMLVHVIFPTVRADLGRDIFHDKSHPVPVKSHCCRALMSLAVFTDYAFHGFLRVKLSTHESGSGPYAVITIASRSTLLYAITAWSGRPFTVPETRKLGKGVIRIFFYDDAESDQFVDIGISYSSLEHLA